MKSLVRIPAITYPHFIRLDNLQKAEALLVKYPDKFPEYEFDRGGWRDYVSGSHTGVEFPMQDVAIRFLNYYMAKDGSFAIYEPRLLDRPKA